MKASIASGLAAATLLFAGTAAAQTAGDPARMPWQGEFWGYIGASAGESKYRDSCNRTITQFQCDDTDTGYKIYAGGKVNGIFGMEIGYTDFGRIPVAGGQTDAWAVPITLTAGVPIGERFNVFAKLGGVYAETDIQSDLDETFSASGSENGWGWTYGAGATFAVMQNLDLRVDWDRYKLDFVGGERDVDMLSAGLQLRF